MSGSIDYGKLMHRAMRSLIQEVLRDVRDTGLPGAHHFFITFDTTHPDARLADWLRDRYPEEMTVVMQNWFDALEVTDEGFSVTLNFGDSPENLSVPYDAIRTFVDPSVEFGLRFESQDEADLTDLPTALHDVADVGLPDLDHDADDDQDDDTQDPLQKEADIVSLDSFRK